MGVDDLIWDLVVIWGCFKNTPLITLPHRPRGVSVFGKHFSWQ